MEDAHILIIAAVDGELAGLNEMLLSPRKRRIGGRYVCSGQLAGTPVRLLAAGPGIINTAQALTAAIEHKRPALIIQTGCAGAFATSGLGVGDLAIADEIVDIHSGLEASEDGNRIEPLPFALMTVNGREIRNAYPLSSSWGEKAYEILRPGCAKQGVRVARGRFITVSTITASDRRAEKLFQFHHPLMEEMEGAAAAHVALHYQIPLLVIRAASNLVGRRDRDGWNLPLAFERASKSVLRCVDRFAF